MAGHDSPKAVIAAFTANSGIAVAKFTAFAFTGSASMLSEGIHSVADAGNQLLLLLGRTDEPRRGHDDLNDVHGFSRALVQAYAEVAGELIENQVPPVQRLEHQDLFDRGLSCARRGSDNQQGP